MRWWHYLVTPFVHGAGCGFPPTWFHLGINVSLFVFQGMLVERVLGSRRFALVTLLSLAVHTLLKYLMIRGRAHGASGMTWSYLLFVVSLIIWMWNDGRWQMFKDWVTVVVVLLSAFAIIALLKHWHTWNLLVSLPFFIAWRKTFRANVKAASQGELVGRGRREWNAVGVGVVGALFTFNGFFVVAAALRWI